ncbi:MAG: queuosine salvage family protein [bacterium]|nr:queuosine salvage family protein [bacterium]
MANVNEAQVKRVADLLKKAEMGSGLNFYSIKKGDTEIVLADMYPPLNHPQVVNYLFFMTAHDFGFWYGDNAGYLEPLYGTIGGKRLKGSDLLWKSCMRRFSEDASMFQPERFADITPETFAKMFSDDNGPVPFPDLEARFMLTRAYGMWFRKYGQSPKMILQNAHDAKNPLLRFLDATSCIPGYDADSYLKKNRLLAMALHRRPEHFLAVTDHEHWKPIVDYHLMRVSLRLGLIDVAQAERNQLRLRAWCSSNMEAGIRKATFDAVSMLAELSGQSMFAIDEALWMARKYCPEIEQPDCAKCLFNAACEKRTELFQPVLRTTAY